MAVNQESVSKVLSVLSHPLRRDILLDLSNNGEQSFTDLLNLLKVDTGKLSFHLRSLAPFIEQTPSGKYRLSRAGESAVRVIHDVEGWAEVADVQGKATSLPLSSFKKRATAFFLDFTIIFAITLAIVIIRSCLRLNWAIWALKSALRSLSPSGCCGFILLCLRALTVRASANAWWV
jgi:DNA-binding HxlR family transcriptional regulator